MERAQILQEQFLKRRAANPGFSLRAFARKLEIGSGRLSEYLSGKRAITPAMADRMAGELGMSLRERKAFLGDGRVPLREEEFALISDPLHFHLLSLFETKPRDTAPPGLAKRLGVSVLEVRGCLDRLERLGFLARDGGKLRLVNAQVRTTHDVPSAALRKSHRRTLEMAIASLDSVPTHLRDISGMTIPTDPARLPEAKKLIAKFRREMAALLERGQPSEVYDCNIQLVPVTIPGGKYEN